jgi:catechol 2,3-dioxygenase-like lactoylglutathione lyase family enzyme
VIAAQRLDHIVIVVRDMERAVAAYGDVGFTVLPGGRHSAAGTANALIPMKDGTYLELFTFETPRPEHSLWPVMERGGGLGQFWLASTDVAADAQRLRELGVPIGPLRAGERRRPDGYVVKFEIATVRAENGMFAPCLIRDVTPMEERVPRAPDHPNGVVGLRSMTIAVEKLEGAARVYAHLLEPAGHRVSTDLDAETAAFKLGSQTLELASPRSKEGPLAALGREQAMGPYELHLTTSARVGKRLDVESAQGIRITVHPLQSAG